MGEKSNGIAADDHIVEQGQPNSDTSAGREPSINPSRTRPTIELSNQDYEDVCKTIGEIDVSKLRAALQSAVYISPMLLLVDSKIFRWSWNQIDILKVCSISSSINPVTVT